MFRVSKTEMHTRIVLLLNAHSNEPEIIRDRSEIRDSVVYAERYAVVLPRA